MTTAPYTGLRLSKMDAGERFENWPAYSLDSNPFEGSWVWMKQHMKSMVIEPVNLVRVVEYLFSKASDNCSMQKRVKRGISRSVIPINFDKIVLDIVFRYSFYCLCMPLSSSKHQQF